MNVPKKEPKPQIDTIKLLDDRKQSLGLQAIILITGCCLIWGYQQIAIQAIADEVPLLMELTMSSIAFFASPKTIMVLSMQKSSLPEPAKT
jgi:hypothetical protein